MYWVPLAYAVLQQQYNVALQWRIIQSWHGIHILQLSDYICTYICRSASQYRCRLTMVHSTFVRSCMFRSRAPARYAQACRPPYVGNELGVTTRARWSAPPKALNSRKHSVARRYPAWRAPPIQSHPSSQKRQNVRHYTIPHHWCDINACCAQGCMYYVSTS
jgi:hypothetical protein